MWLTWRKIAEVWQNPRWVLKCRKKKSGRVGEDIGTVCEATKSAFSPYEGWYFYAGNDDFGIPRYNTLWDRKTYKTREETQDACKEYCKKYLKQE